MRTIPTDNPDGGRPMLEFEDHEIAQVEALGAVLAQKHIAAYFGIAENTLSAIFERQPAVFEAYKRGKARAIATVGGKLIERARNGEPWAVCFYLKTQGGYRETTRLDIKDEDGVLKPTQITLVAKPLPDEQDGDG